MSSYSLIDQLCAKIPPQLGANSGGVFYSGSDAFIPPKPLYVLGINPGGDPADHTDNTISESNKAFARVPARWSAYRDETWRGRGAGTVGMQPRVLHMFKQLNLDPVEVPCSNLIFVRSRREADIRADFEKLANLCWPFHALAIEQLRPRAVLCFGRKVGKYVRTRVGADKEEGQFIERNMRRWRSQVFSNSMGLRVVVATHPSIADWCAPSADPSGLVKEALK